MNFVPAFLWMALLLSIGLAAYIVYALTKKEKDDNEQKDEKDKPDPGNKKPFPTGKKITNNGVQLSNIRDSQIEVNNINNCPFNSGVIGNNQVAEEEQTIEP